MGVHLTSLPFDVRGFIVCEIYSRPVYTTPDLWYGTDENGRGAKREFSSFIYTSIPSREKQFYFCVWSANQTQMFVQDSVSRIDSKPLGMSPVLFQNGGWRVSGSVSPQFL